MAEFEGLDPPGARLDSIAECVGTGAKPRRTSLAENFLVFAPWTIPQNLAY